MIKVKSLNSKSSLVREFLDSLKERLKKELEFDENFTIREREIIEYILEPVLPYLKDVEEEEDITSLRITKDGIEVICEDRRGVEKSSNLLDLTSLNEINEENIKNFIEGCFEVRLRVKGAKGMYEGVISFLKFISEEYINEKKG